MQLFAENDVIRERYAGRFRYVHVDEYQDTNMPQYRLITQLASVHQNLCVVGDDDQSIYGWRGADIGNILSFEEQYPNAFVVRLEQNYRSTSIILNAANAVVKNNRRRKDKTLWTDQVGGEPLRLTLVGDEEEEGQLIVEGLTRAVHRQGRSLKDVAILYRTNAQSRAIENALRRAAVPYELVGGVPFYQRREVKDLLAYLRLAVNPVETAWPCGACSTCRSGASARPPWIAWPRSASARAWACSTPRAARGRSRTSPTPRARRCSASWRS